MTQEMLFAILLFIVGLVLLIKGGDWFVDGATGIAHQFHIPEIIIGATIVSIGTTLPEVMVSATAAVEGHGEIAYGNAIGSIICNTSLIAALSIAIRPSVVERKTFKIPVIFFFIAAVFYVATAYFGGTFTRIHGIILLFIFVIYIVYTIMITKKDMQKEKKVEKEEIKTIEEIDIDEQNKKKESKEEKTNKLVRDIIFLVLGAVCIAFGARLLVDNGTILARELGVPESVIALTFVALGTSLPELVTAITSLVKGHISLSFGNIIGANMFNLVLVSGVSITLMPFNVPTSQTIVGINSSLILDIPLMLIVMLILTIPALVKGKLSRFQGILLLILYATFCVIQFII